jgi:ABC-type multidrug transport system fused ATPase/permease subunit
MTAHTAPARAQGLTPLLIAYLRPQGVRVALLMATLLVGVGLQLAGPQLTSRFIDVVVRQKARAPLDALVWLATLFIAVTIAGQLVRLASAYFSSAVGWGATNQLRLDLARHCLALDMGFHNRRTAGELIERIDGDVTALTQLFSQFVFQILGSVLLVVGILAVLFVRNPWVGAALSVFAGGAFLVLQRTRNLGVPLYEAERQARADIAGFVEERLGGLDDIRANGGGAHVARRMDALNTELKRRGVKAIRVAAVYIVLIANGVTVIGFALAMALGVWLFQHRRASIGSIYLLVQYTAMLRAPLEQIGTQFQALQRAMAGLKRVRELQATPERIVGGAGAGWTAATAPSVAFDHVSFAYEDAASVLHDVGFRLEPGETLGLLGRTGSGKTTITRLLARLYDPAAGAVRLDGRDLREATLAELRAQVGVVTQDVQIFRASVRENLTLFDPAISDARLTEALADLGLGAWFARQPQGLDTLLEAGARQLSAGEAQLLAFARVFLRDPGLVLLDEASSRLDPATERLIEDTLQRLVGRGGAGRPRTAIIVAHRLATVARVDRIMILEAGRIVEQGERAALAADPGSRFAQLLRTGLEEVLA